MKIFKNFIGLAALALCLGFASCSSDDDAPSYSNVAVSNSELMTILKAKGYQFDENGKMLLDDKANSTTSLDLSGTKVDTAALKELSVFPNLKELNLSSNGYSETFDFSVLPAQITGIDLTNNDIYNYDNLVKVTVEENDDETVENVHNITKLYLPEEAKYNIAQLMRFYRQNKSAIDGGTMDVKMQNEDGVSEKYNTLREVPDANLRTYLKNNFSDLFNGDNIDISKHLGNEQKSLAVAVMESDNVENFEGLQYLVDNPYWEGTSLALFCNEGSEGTLSYIKVGSTLSTLILQGIKIDNLNLTSANGLYLIRMIDIQNLKDLNISKSSVWGQRSKEVEGDEMVGSFLSVYNCPSLESITLPNKKELKATYLDVEVLPSLKVFDMSNIVMLGSLLIGDLPTSYDLVYPNLTVFYNFDTSMEPTTTFTCSKDTYNRNSTKEFIDKYYKNANPQKLSYYRRLNCPLNKGYNWTK